ncbi:MAG TPA: glycosyltransferase, partial [Thermoflexales bacterium]|nr:glycosyltransferase [Thermoflexales bacterium]
DACRLDIGRTAAEIIAGNCVAAFAHGAAIITTTPRVPLPELSDGQNVLLVPPDEPAKLADAIQRVLRDDVLRARLQAGSSQLHHLFGWDEIARQTAQVFAAAGRP